MSKAWPREEVLETTLGDFIVALTEEAAPFVRNEREANQVVAYILADLLHNAGRIPENRPVIVRKTGRGKTLVVH